MKEIVLLLLLRNRRMYSLLCKLLLPINRLALRPEERTLALFLLPSSLELNLAYRLLWRINRQHSRLASLNTALELISFALNLLRICKLLLRISKLLRLLQERILQPI